MDVGDVATSVVAIEALELPRDGELVMKPVRLRVHARHTNGDRPLRVQLLLRGIRHDGGVLQWFVGADGRAPVGERGFQLGSAGAREATFGRADYGPVRVESLTALQVAVAVVPVEPEDNATFMGLGATLALNADHDALSAAVEQDGATLLMAYQLPVKLADDVAPGHYTQRLVIAGTPTAGRVGPERLHALKGAEVLSANREPVDDLSVFVVDLHIEVPHHE